MKKDRILPTFVSVALLMIMLPVTAFANSSWVWFTYTRPYDLLPFIITITLFIEIISINYLTGVNSLPRVIPVVTFANLISFLAPYVFMGMEKDSNYASDNGFFATIESITDHLPIYIVGLKFLLITVLFEAPIVYFFCRKKAKSRKTLLIVILASNAVTTAIAAVIEHMICIGEW